MASFSREDLEELEDSFEIEFSHLPGTRERPAIQFWQARRLDAVANRGERRRRNSAVAALVAIMCLVFINSLAFSALSSAAPSKGPAAHSMKALSATGANYSGFALRQRPLHLPKVASGAPCPVAPLSQRIIQLHKVMGIGNETVFAVPQNMDAAGVQYAEHAQFARLGATYGGELVRWYVRLPDNEPVLIRGAQLDGPGVLLFDGGIEQPSFASDILAGRTLSHLLISSDPDHGTPVAQWLSITRIRDSGCYAYQVDMPRQSMVLVFRAVVEP